MNFKSFKETEDMEASQIPLDGNLAVADFEKMQNIQLSYLAFEALDNFRNKYQRLPAPWSLEDAK
jgi:hypothetical protein